MGNAKDEKKRKVTKRASVSTEVKKKTENRERVKHLKKIVLLTVGILYKYSEVVKSFKSTV